MEKPKLSLQGLRVLVVGLAREGSAVAEYLARQGAIVTVTDAQAPQKLADKVAALQHLKLNFVLGEHPDWLLEPGQTDLLIVSPGVPLDIPFLQQAQARRLPLTTESRLFAELCPAPIVGISGSSGKTTTTTLTAKMLQASGFTTHIGGNIGTPLLNRVDQISPADWVVMELSSFQLEYFHPRLNRQANIPDRLSFLKRGWSPKIGALLNITPNHLDRHKTMTAYTEAKTALVNYMGPTQTAVLSFDDPATRQIGASLSANINWFSRLERVKRGASVVKGQISLVEGENITSICKIVDIKLRGEHNISNILAACTIAHTAGATPQAMERVAPGFSGVAHRLEVVATEGGVTYINDSIATSPERLVAALNSFEQPVILLAGGKDKDLPWQTAAEVIRQRVKHLLLFGDAEDLIFEAVSKVKQETSPLSITRCGSLEEAVLKAKKLAQSGDVVLLSPGGTSFDAYPDFAARGEHFRELVRARD